MYSCKCAVWLHRLLSVFSSKYNWQSAELTWFYTLQRKPITSQAHDNQNDLWSYDEFIFQAFIFIWLMCYSAAITFAWKSLQLKYAQMKIWMRDSSINIPGFIPYDGCGCLDTEITPLFHLLLAKTAGIQQRVTIVISNGIPMLHSSIWVGQTNIDLSQDHNKLILPLWVR